MSLSVLIVGGHGKVALKLAKILSGQSHRVSSLIRNKDHAADIEGVGAKPVLLSLEDASASDISKAIDSSEANAVVFSAGAGGKGGKERTLAVDLHGARKVADAIADASKKRHLHYVMVSAICAHPRGTRQAHWNDEDVKRFEGAWEAIGTYNQAKLDADKEIISRFSKDENVSYTILRPGGLKDDDGKGMIDLGATHYGDVSREDVAAVIAELLIHPKETNGLVLDLVSGDTPIKDAVNNAIKHRVSNPPEL